MWRLQLYYFFIVFRFDSQENSDTPLSLAVRSVLQVLHGCCERAVKATLIPGTGLEWAQHYIQHVESDRVCLNEWEAMNDLESVRRDSDGQR